MDKRILMGWLALGRFCEGPVKDPIAGFSLKTW